ncbi:CheR family methyltransferase [Maridesulfovibrio sp.]|uniref:CheR family methyltransferase n=1 Tax=Maridesulfovibrio sp. TaxID=2795000 RepID=UPI002A18BBC4|nr:CheR family methyltransferase [Maridesulfovibrio sp.]
MNLEPFHKILNKAMGLSPDSLGRSGVAHAVGVRMRITGCDEERYLALLRASEEEQAELVEEIVVPETWFFRDVRPFELLSETAFRSRRGVFRVLSAPCSTGEEPYSIAMTLMGAGLEPSRFRVDGVDISRRAIEKARCGLYSENSFRNVMPEYAKSCFNKCSGGRQLAGEILDAVNFYTGNIVEGCLPAGKYDVIFCRNLLIYLDDKSKVHLARMLSEKLDDQGLLFVGHAELLPVFNDWFTPLGKNGTFALKKGKRKVAGLLKERKPTWACRPQLAMERKARSCEVCSSVADGNELDRKEIQSPASDSAAVAPDMKTGQSGPGGVDRVRELADRGLTGSALSMCEELLHGSGPEPELYYLCGLLHEANGNETMAEDYYGRALYLDPHHVESLVHLSLLLENRGEVRKAELLRNRVRRAEKL